MDPFSCSLLRLFPVLCIVLFGMGKTTVALSNSCAVTRSTMQVVEDCPDSKETWNEAAARKNCAAYASECDEPERLVYHCVINPYVNQTLEVCAYAQNILSGHCTSYSFSGNLILQNLRTNCAAFSDKSCPIFYRSDTAYNYPGCYELIKKSTTDTVTYISKITSKPEITAVLTTLSSNGSSNAHVDTPGKDMLMLVAITTVISGILIAAFITFIVVFLWRKNGKIVCNKHFRKDARESNANEEETMNLKEQNTGKTA